MRRILRPSLVIAAAATAAVLPLLTDVTPSAAAGPAGWRTAQEFGASYGNPELTGGVAVSAQSAWAAGYTFLTQDSVFLAHWDGSQWSQVAGPAALTSTSASVSPGPVEVSGANLWDFPTAWAARNRVYAARLTSGHWTTWRLPGALRIDGAAVFGTSDVWAFGEALLPPGWTGLQNGPSYAERFNGQTWRRVQLPGVPLVVRALARNDIWAYGPTNRTAAAASQDFVAMHWNGSTWKTLPIPRMRAANGRLMWPAGFTVLNNGSLWATEDFHCPTPGSCNPPQPPGMLLARWNGHRWVSVLESLSFELPSVEPDGHGGLWLSALTAKNPRWAFLHYVSGRLSVSFPPATAAGPPGNVSLPIPIPGTRSAWSTGDVQLGGGSTVAAVFKLGP